MNGDDAAGYLSRRAHRLTSHSKCSSDRLLSQHSLQSGREQYSAPLRTGNIETLVTLLFARTGDGVRRPVELQQFSRDRSVE
jgi:hypothetical protein